MRYRLAVVLCLAGLLIVSAPAFAQRTTGDIVGTVSDESGAVIPGVTVTLTGEFAAGSFTSITNTNGVYRFNRLHPGSYDLSFNMDGFSRQTRTGLRVSLGATTEENVTLTLGALTDEVTVTADSVVVDATDVGLSNTFDTEMVENLPLRRSSLTDLMLTAPGVVTGSEGGNIMAMGSETDSNAYMLDGVLLNTVSDGTMWATPHTDITAEVETMTLGAPAEYGQVTGAVFNVISKQGSNSFRGEASFYYRSDDLMARNTDDDYDGGLPYYVDQWRDIAAQLGGPIVQDKLWFFASYGNKIDSFSGAGNSPDFPRFHHYKTYFGKLNWQINPEHKIQFSMNVDDFVTERNAAPFRSPTTNKMFFGTTPAPAFSYTGLLTDKTMLEVRYGGFYGTKHSSPKNLERRDGPYFINNVTGGDCAVGPCRQTGGANYWYDLNEVSTNATVSLSHYADDFLGGSHDFKFGVQYKRAGREDAVVGYTDVFYLYQDSYGDEYVLGYDYSPFSYGGIAGNRAVFVDDTFRVNDRLTLKLGARYDIDRASVPELAPVDGAGNPTGAVVPAVDNLYDFHSFSPRLGFTYKLTEDGKTLLRGHWGRYHRGMNTMDFGGGVGNVGTTDLATFIGYYDVEGFYAETLEGDGRGTNVGGAGNVAIDPDIKSGHTDQAVLGFERELSANLGVGLTYTHKRASNFAAWRDSTGVYETFDTVEPITGTPLTLSRLISDPEDRFYLLGTSEDLFTRIHAAVLVLNKRMSDGWQLKSSLQLMRGTGQTNTQGSTGGRMRGGIPWGSFGKRPNDFVNVGGRLIGDHPVTFKTQLMVELPAGVLLGANYTFQQGGTWRRTARINTGPFSDTIKLEQADGSRRKENRSLLDLRIQWGAKLTEEASLSFFLDTFNVFNSGAGNGIRTNRVDRSDFGLPSDIAIPRRLQVGARFQF